MKKIKNIILIMLFTLAFGCGYTPIIEIKKTNIYIAELDFSGDRRLNNHILNNLKKYQLNKEGSKIYKLYIASDFKKISTNEDDSGNPKNYNLEVKLNVNILSEDGNSISKIFAKTASFDVKNKKIEEKENENQYLKYISQVLSEEIIFYLNLK